MLRKGGKARRGKDRKEEKRGRDGGERVIRGWKGREEDRRGKERRSEDGRGEVVLRKFKIPFPKKACP